MRISDWSSDVCSSDLLARHGRVVVKPARGEQGAGVAVDLSTPADVEAAIERARRVCDRVLIEEQIGRASWRERVCQYVLISVVDVSLKKKLKQIYTKTVSIKPYSKLHNNDKSN